MKTASPAPSYTDRIRSWVTSKAHGDPQPQHHSSTRSDPPILPISNPRSNNKTAASPPSRVPPSSAPAPGPSSGGYNAGPTSSGGPSRNPGDPGGGASSSGDAAPPNEDAPGNGRSLPPGPSSQAAEQGPVLGSNEGHAPTSSVARDRSPPAAPATTSPIPDPGDTPVAPARDCSSLGAALWWRFVANLKKIALHSKVNLALVFVPVGIAVAQVHSAPPALVFSLNAIAIIPLAGLLSHATESVARRLGDSLGALINVTFGNAVELIILIALVQNEIRIVQASLLGSILANLLLILGMSFLLGGLRFREQIYNSTVTQMSACLLSLSVISLVLPTAFHASFSDTRLADAQSLKISRGTSIVLLLVYIIYLLFQLKSHAYMYESTPQRIIDEECEPGPAASWLDPDSLSSDESDSSSSGSASGGSNHSRQTMSRRVRRVIRGGRRRKSSVVSSDTAEVAAPTRTPSFGACEISPVHGGELPAEELSTRPRIGTGASPSSVVSVDTNEEAKNRRHRSSFKRHRKHKHRHHSPEKGAAGRVVVMVPNLPNLNVAAAKAEVDSNMVMLGEPRRVDFAITDLDSTADGQADAASSNATLSRRPFPGLRGMSLRPVAKSLAPTVFVRPAGPGVAPMLPVPPSGPVPRVRYGIRRTNSLPDRLNQFHYPPGAPMLAQTLRPASIGAGSTQAPGTADPEQHDDLSRTAAVMLLLATTILVAFCAEYMVDSIEGLVATSNVGEVFIGLIILPIVANAAEHFTAVVVALKNKMDLCIGVAVGSSIQIALFVTPLVVILGWIMNRDMTLYFTLFETVCLFVSAFIVNFLVLDGRSNFLEGALLCATYVIIAVVAFYYPADGQTSAIG